MKTASVFSVDPFALGNESEFYFNVVVIYDKRDSAMRAKTVFDRLMDQFAGQFYFQCDFWRFDVLELPEVQQQAVWAGQTADLIIVASESSETSIGVKQWLDQCLSNKADADCALVQLFHNTTASDNLQSEMQEFLKPFATGVDFFVHEIQAPQRHFQARGHHPD